MNNKGADQTARMCMLIGAFVVPIWRKQVLSWCGSFVSSGKDSVRWQRIRSLPSCISRSRSCCVRMVVVSMATRRGKDSVRNVTVKSTKKRKTPRSNMILINRRWNRKFNSTISYMKWPVRPVKTQISLGIRPVWSKSSLCALWVAVGSCG